MKNKIVKDISGVAVIEFALILPVLLLILLGVIEFGVYFMKEQIVQRTVSTTASAIQQDPTDASIQMTAYDSGAGLVDYRATGNYICAKSYATAVDAKNFLCAAGDWVTTPPTGVAAGVPYYIALVAYVQESSFTELFKKYIPVIQVSSIFKGNSATLTFYTVSSTMGNVKDDAAVVYCHDGDIVISGGGYCQFVYASTYYAFRSSRPVKKGDTIWTDGTTATGNGWYADCNGNPSNSGRAQISAVCLHTNNATQSIDLPAGY